MQQWYRITEKILHSHIIRQWFPTTFLEAPNTARFSSHLCLTPPIQALESLLMIWIRCVWLGWHGKHAVLGVLQERGWEPHKTMFREQFKITNLSKKCQDIIKWKWKNIWNTLIYCIWYRRRFLSWCEAGKLRSWRATVRQSLAPTLIKNTCL